MLLQCKSAAKNNLHKNFLPLLVQVNLIALHSTAVFIIPIQLATKEPANQHEWQLLD
jgi:hypothetical protein